MLITKERNGHKWKWSLVSRIGKMEKNHDEHGINETITTATSLYKWLYFYIDEKGMENKGEWTIII